MENQHEVAILVERQVILQHAFGVVSFSSVQFVVSSVLEPRSRDLRVVVVRGNFAFFVIGVLVSNIGLPLGR